MTPKSLRKFSATFLMAATLCLAPARPALAHDTWLLARSSAVQPGTPVILDLTSGMAFPANETAIKPDRVARAGLRLAGKTSDLKDRRSAATSLEFTALPSEPGVAALWVELAPKSIELKPDQVQEYLDEIGASPEIRRAWAESTEPRHWRESYVKHAKTYVRVGRPAADSSWAEPAGMALEIVPEKDPTALRPGDALPVRVLRDGQPLPSFAVGLVHEGDAHGSLATTDATGRATLRLDRAGRWLLRATELRRSAKPDRDWESDFTTVSLSVEPAGEP